MKVLLLKLMKRLLHSLHEHVAPTLREDDDDAWQDIIRDSIALAMWQSYVQM